MGLDLTVGWPLALWGLIAAPLLVLLALRSRFPIGPKRRAAVIATRVLTAALLVLAMADLRLGLPTDELAVATVIDGTPSVTVPDRERVQQQLAELRAENDDVAWVDATSPTAVRPSTDVSVGVALLPRDRVRRMIVATDGRDRGADLGAAIAAAHRAGVEVSVVPMGDEPPMDLVSVTGLSVPRMIRAGDRIDVGVELHAARDANVRLTMALDGEEVGRTDAVARRGDSSASIGVEFPEDEGVHELTVALSAAGDVVPQNDVWRSLVRISPKPRVRILYDPENGPPLLSQVFDEGGMRVEATPITAAPLALSELQDVNLVIVDEADPGDLTEVQQQVLRDWVEDEGGGLISATGTNPVRRTPRIFREMEPITIPPAIPEPRPLELVLVIDRSSSMSGIKMMQARNAAIAAVRALRQDARAGVVAFSGGADRVMAPVGMDQRDDLIQFIGGIHASGGTNIAAALGAANAVMSNDPRYIHHVILLSDGVSSPQPAHRRSSFEPRVVTHLAMLEDVDLESAPQLGGHALAGLERGATMVLSTPDRRPVLAHWHRGLGQVATWTSATSGAWADGWRGWDGYRAFWVAMAEGMLRTRPVDPPQIRLAPHPLLDGVQVATVLAPTLESDPAPLVRIFRAPGEGEPLELFERGPGVWQSEILADGGFLLDARMPGDERPTVAVGHDRPYDPELSLFGTHRAELERLAAAGGGGVLDELGAIVGAVDEESVMRSLRTPLLAAALLMYLLGLLLLRLPDHSVGATVVRPERKRRRWGRERKSMHPEEPKKEAA